MNMSVEKVSSRYSRFKKRIQLKVSFVYTIGARSHISMRLFILHSFYFSFDFKKRVKFLKYSHLYSVFCIPIQYEQASVMLISLTLSLFPFAVCDSSSKENHTNLNS